MANDIKPDQTLDCIGLYCPEPLLQTRTHIDQIDEQHIKPVKHFRGRPPLFPVKAEDGQAGHLINRVVGLDHIILFFRKETVLR